MDITQTVKAEILAFFKALGPDAAAVGKQVFKKCPSAVDQREVSSLLNHLVRTGELIHAPSGVEGSYGLPKAAAEQQAAVAPGPASLKEGMAQITQALEGLDDAMRSIPTESATAMAEPVTAKQKGVVEALLEGTANMSMPEALTVYLKRLYPGGATRAELGAAFPNRDLQTISSALSGLKKRQILRVEGGSKDALGDVRNGRYVWQAESSEAAQAKPVQAPLVDGVGSGDKVAARAIVTALCDALGGQTLQMPVSKKSEKLVLAHETGEPPLEAPASAPRSLGVRLKTLLVLTLPGVAEIELDGSEALFVRDTINAYEPQLRNGL